MLTKDELIRDAKEIFDFEKCDVRTYFSPGRINLIGEHIDYNGGYVLPASINMGTYGVASLRNDNLICCYSKNFSDLGIINFNISDIIYKKEDNWVNYVKGVIKEISNKRNINYGFNIYIYGDLPNASGLSSSASLELLIGYVANDLLNLDLTNLELVKIGKAAENNFVGVNCGIMDQFAIGMGQINKAILLNTNTMDYQYINLDLEDYCLVIGNTNKKRTLTDSKYNERRSECEEALAILNKEIDINNLCDLSIIEYEKYFSLLPSDALKKRVRHVVMENARVHLSTLYLENKELGKFGKLLNDSHDSLRDNYEVTGIELDTLVNSFRKHGSIGARMTGAGFGGCMIALIRKDNVEEIISKVSDEYLKEVNLFASFYKVELNGVLRKM